MAIRIDVVPTIPDARSLVKLKAFREIAGSGITTVHLVDSYILDADLSTPRLIQAEVSLTNPKVEKSFIGRWVPGGFTFAIEIGFLPGVTDNVGTTARETIEDATKKAFKDGEAVYSSQVFFIEGEISRAEAEKIAKSLYNPLIQSAQIFDASGLKKSGAASVPRVSLHGSSKVLDVNLEVGDEELLKIGTFGIKDENGNRRGPLALDLDFLKAIQAHFRKLKRNPTDIELEALAQTWSEHCKHTIFANPIDDDTEGIYKKYIKGATAKIRKDKGKKDFCVSVFKDNAGGIVFDDEYVITHKVETHNSPSALDPFGGAITGIVGVNRDTIGFGLGAKPVANVYGFCFGLPDDTRGLYRDKAKTQEMLSSQRIAEGVIKGINAGGNQSGIPTPHGFMMFDESYRGKPLVFAGTVGLIPKKNGKRILYEKKAKPGDYIVMVGGRVGLDGIHGATFSSVGLDSGSPATAVQIGDPITQKKFSDAIVKEARDMNLYNSITDNGAGGLSSSVGEMAKESNGCRVDLHKVPLKYPGLEPWQIWISESQERMTLAVPKAKWPAFSKLMKSRAIEATVIGEFTKSGKCIVVHRKKKIMDLSLEFLHDGLPKKYQVTKKPVPITHNLKPETHSKDFSAILLKLLARYNLASNEFLSRQFDHEVQGGSVIKPIQGAGRGSGDASVFRPRLDSKRAVVLSSGLVPEYANLDPYKMAAASIDTAVRNSIAAGATLDHLAILDNFCWTSSNEPERLWQLKEAAKACYDYATLYGTPFISGKDSMFNDFKGYDEKGEFLKISILPTLLISTLGVIQDAEKAISIDAKVTGDAVYLLGETHDELGGSEYARMEGSEGGDVPRVDGEKNMKLYRAFSNAAEKELIASAISVGRGGIGVALTKTAMAGKIGIDADLSKVPGTTKESGAILFGESQGRIIATISPANAQKFEKLFSGIPFQKIGTISNSENLSIICGEKNINVPLVASLEAYRSTFKNW
jgi:phosphoribosylformylglycinamidine synthase